MNSFCRILPPPATATERLRPFGFDRVDPKGTDHYKCVFNREQRGDVRFVHQSLYYPVTDAAQDTPSYRQFADGPFLTAKGIGLVLGRLPSTAR